MLEDVAINHAAVRVGVVVPQRLRVQQHHVGQRVDTSRIAHSVKDGVEIERIEALDGSPREVLRSGSEVKCFFPDEKLLIVENRASQRGFPALLPTGLGSLPEYYMIRENGTARVAGVQSRCSSQ